MRICIRVFAKVVMTILSDTESRIIRLYYFYGYLEREIGEMMGLHRRKVSRIKKKAILKLREIMQN